LESMHASREVRICDFELCLGPNLFGPNVIANQLHSFQ
jgi:hypothetical protein